MAYLFISHDLGVVRYLADRIVVLYLGRIMEIGTAEVVFNSPTSLHRGAARRCRRSTISTACASAWRARSRRPPTRRPGCPFHTRCPRKIGEICETTEPELDEDAAGHGIRCHIPRDELRRLQQLPGE